MAASLIEGALSAIHSAMVAYTPGNARMITNTLNIITVIMPIVSLAPIKATSLPC